MERRSIELEGRTLRWDRLVLAIGSRIADPGLAASMRLESHAVAALAARLRALPASAHVAVVGTGLTGIETATEAVRRDESR